MAADAGRSRAPYFNRRTGTATGVIAVLAGPPPAPGEISDLLTERCAHTLLVGSDVSPHLHRVALPTPGDDAELFRAVAHALQCPLDADRPLWECWIIEGLQDGRWAILIKIGQQLAEHLPPARLITRLCDQDRAAYTDSAAAQPDSAAQSLGRPAQSLGRPAPRRPAAARWPARSRWPAGARWQAGARAVNGLTGAAGALLTGGRPPTARRYRTVVVPRGDVDHLCNRFGVSADDIALAALTEGFRTVLVQPGQQPPAAALRTVATTLTQLPIEHRDPLAQLRAVRAQAGPRPANLSPIALCVKVIHALTGLPQQTVTLSSAPPGPRYRLRLTGRRIERLLPIPPTAPDGGTGVAVLSYGDELVFGISTDYDTKPDALAAGIEVGMAGLVAAGRDSVVLLDHRRKRQARTLPNGAPRWRPAPRTARVRH